MDFFRELFGTVRVAVWAALVVFGILALGVIMLLHCGCQRATVTEQYQTQTRPPVAAKTGEIVPDTKAVSRTTSHTRVMTWAGPSPGETIAQMQPLEVTEDGAKFSGMKPFDLAKKGPMLLVYAGIGIALIGLGLIVFLPGARTAGIYAAVGGGALIVAGIAFESYPWLALAIVILAVVAGIAWFIIGTAAGAKVRTALQAVVAGVAQTEKTDPGAAKAVKTNIETAASGAGQAVAVKATITAAKQKV